MGNREGGDIANVNRRPWKTSPRRWHLNKAMKKTWEWAMWLSEGRVLQAGEMARAKALRQAVPGMFQEQQGGQASVAEAGCGRGRRGRGLAQTVRAMQAILRTSALAPR